MRVPSAGGSGREGRTLSARSFLPSTESALPLDRTYKGCAVAVEGDDLTIAGASTQEAAIAKVERHLRGSHEIPAPADPLCRRTGEF